MLDPLQIVQQMLKTIKHIVESTDFTTQQAWWLLEFITNKNRSQLQFSSEAITAAQQEQLDECINQIAVHHKPLAYILGWVPFLDLELTVTPPTLIPRPETEMWVNELISMIQRDTNKPLTILDIGTGSGCIALSLAQALPTAQIYAVDIAPCALELAQKNSISNKISNVTFLESNLFNNLPADFTFDLIVSNPPYINPTAQLDTSVLAWEDHKALFANNEGLQIIEQIAEQAHKHLKKNADLTYQLVMEIDSSQGDVIKNILEKYAFNKVKVEKDQFKRYRTVWAK